MIRSLAVALMALGPMAAAAQDALPIDIGGPFALTDQTGNTRTEADPEGRAQLLFFGYANCQQICSASLPLMADAADILASEGKSVRLVMITVDPEHDTAQALGPSLARYHRDFVGLTGTDAALQVAYDAFGVEKELLFVDPQYGPVYAHGSFIYLLDGDGDILTLLPPILAPSELARIASGYLDETG